MARRQAVVRSSRKLIDDEESKIDWYGDVYDKFSKTELEIQDFK